MKNDDTRIYLVGAGLGLAIGLLSAYLYRRAAQENAASPHLSVTAVIKLILLLVGLIRQIAELGAEAEKKSA